MALLGFMLGAWGFMGLISLWMKGRLGYDGWGFFRGLAPWVCFLSLLPEFCFSRVCILRYWSRWEI